jgi:hypothetical protein
MSPGIGTASDREGRALPARLRIPLASEIRTTFFGDGCGFTMAAGLRSDCPNRWFRASPLAAAVLASASRPALAAAPLLAPAVLRRSVPRRRSNVLPST